MRLPPEVSPRLILHPPKLVTRPHLTSRELRCIVLPCTQVGKVLASLSGQFPTVGEIYFFTEV